MRSDYETFLARRGDVLKDLQAVSRRANSITPVVNYEDLGIIRNTIGPALNVEKFGQAWANYLSESPTLLFGPFIKEAGFWGDPWGSLWGGIKGVGSTIKNVVLAPYNIGKGIYEGWTQGGGPWYVRLGRALGGTALKDFQKGWGQGEAILKDLQGGRPQSGGPLHSLLGRALGGTAPEDFQKGWSQGEAILQDLQGGWTQGGGPLYSSLGRALGGAAPEDLQAVSRASSITPVVNYEDPGIIRSTIGPALNVEKFGQAWANYLSESPTLLFGPFIKEAGFWGDLWGGATDIAGGLWGGIKGIGSSIKDVVLAPYNIGKGVYEGWTQSGDPWYSRLGGALGGAVEGVFRPIEDLGGALYQQARGAVRGLGRWTQLEHVDAIRRAAQAADPWAEAGFKYVLPTVAMSFLPGGQAGAAARIAGTGGRIARLAGGVGRGLRMAEVPAEAVSAAAQGGRLARMGRAAANFFVPTRGELSALGQTARGAGTAARELVTAPSIGAAGRLARSTLGTGLQAAHTLVGPVMAGGIVLQTPNLVQAWQQGWRPWQERWRPGLEQQAGRATGEAVATPEIPAPQIQTAQAPQIQAPIGQLQAPPQRQTTVQPVSARRPEPQPEQDFSSYLGGAFRSAWLPAAQL